MLADPKEEVKDEDNVSIEEDFSDSIGKNKNIVLHLISQLKLGMDLTKVCFFIFILFFKSIQFLEALDSSTLKQGFFLIGHITDFYIRTSKFIRNVCRLQLIYTTFT